MSFISNADFFTRRENFGDKPTMFVEFMEHVGETYDFHSLYKLSHSIYSTLVE